MNIIREKYYYKCNTILDGVRPAVIKELDANAKTLSFKKNKTLFKEGGYPDGVYKLVKGKVKIYQRNPDGKFQIVYMYTKGEFFGFRPIVSNTKHPASAITMEDCHLVFYPKAAFLKAIDDSQVMTKNLLMVLGYEFNVWINLMSSFSHKSVKERVAFALLILNEKFKKKADEKSSIIDLGREDLASFSGTTTESCVRILTQLKEDKVLETNGRKIKLLKIKELFDIADIHDA